MYYGDEFSWVMRLTPSVTTISVAAFVGNAVYLSDATDTNYAVCDLTSVEVSPPMDDEFSGHPRYGKPAKIFDSPRHNDMPDIARVVDAVKRYSYYRGERRKYTLVSSIHNICRVR